MSRAPVEAAEVRCTEAEETADALDAWVEESAGDPAQEEGMALAAMLRALAKSLRMACLSDDEKDRADLMEEVESTIGMAAALIEKGSTLETSRDALRTVPPPPGYDPKAAFGISVPAQVARVRLMRIARPKGSSGEGSG